MVSFGTEAGKALKFEMATVMTRSGGGGLDAAGVGSEANPCAGLCAADSSSGETGTDALTQALELAREAAAGITAQFGTALDRAARVKVSRAFDRVLVPREKRPPGRKRKAAITAAYLDWKAGMRGHQFYLKHIPGYSGMGRYRRECAQRRLNEAIRSRRRRDQLVHSNGGPVSAKPPIR
jgi:hypothetical protein